MAKKKNMIRVVNKYGLYRSIPAEVKLKVRQRCGFGCVVCGLAIYHYEHFAPAFENARSHESMFKFLTSCFTAS